MKRSLITLLGRLTSLLFVLALFSLQACAQTQSLPQNEGHEVSLDSARHFIANLNKDAVQMKTKGGMFYREAFDKILAQKDCIGIRYYYAKTEDGTPTLVLVGVDSNGNDMVDGAIMERIHPCPPFCDSTTQLQSNSNK
jgi:hypothetical protein